MKPRDHIDHYDMAPGFIIVMDKFVGSLWINR